MSQTRTQIHIQTAAQIPSFQNATPTDQFLTDRPKSLHPGTTHTHPHISASQITRNNKTKTKKKIARIESRNPKQSEGKNISGLRRGSAPLTKLTILVNAGDELAGVERRSRRRRSRRGERERQQEQCGAMREFCGGEKNCEGFYTKSNRSLWESGLFPRGRVGYGWTWSILRSDVNHPLCLEIRGVGGGAVGGVHRIGRRARDRPGMGVAGS